MLKVRSFDKCVFELSKLPGIGKKTAQRLAMYIMKMSESEVKELSESLVNLKKAIKYCRECGGLSDSDICSICSDESRDREVVCVVEEPKDIFIIEASGRFKGVYHVLGGKIAPLDGIGPDEIKIRSLIPRLENGEVEEVIVATDPNAEGDATAMYLAKLIKPLGVKVTRIAHGIPVGGDLEYADEVTLSKALEGRREL